MTREAIIQKTVQALQILQEESKAFSFLNDEEDLYSTNDIKERF
jgi:hypothetical protein